MLDLRPMKAGQGDLVLETPLAGRILLAGVAVFLGCLAFFAAAFSLVPGVLALIALAAAFYKETWHFDSDRRLVVHAEGVLFLTKKKTYAFSELARVELRNSGFAGNRARSDFDPESFSPSPLSVEAMDQDPAEKPRGRGFSGLFLLLLDGREVSVHMTSIRRAPQQDRLGQMISRVCRIPYSTYT
jgi:hypothetical protein